MTFVTCINITGNVAEWVPNMQTCTTWIREHVQNIIFWFITVVRRFKGLSFCPNLLPLFLYIVEVVFHRPVFLEIRCKFSGITTQLKTKRCITLHKHFLFYFYTINPHFMASSFDKYQKRKLISSYISVVISIALVLFLLGCLGLLVINSKKVADHFKEQVVMTIYLNDTAKEVEVNQLKKSLAMAEYSKEATYVSKEEAAELMKAETGEDFMDFVGYNPLKNSIDVYLKADFVTTEKLSEISESLANKSFIEDIRYDNDLVELMNDNVKKISFWVLIISGLFTLIAVLLINSSIRLAVYSKRFIIKTMQMVGATKSFIRRPFVWKSVQLGIIGAIVALAGMAVVLYYLDLTFPELELLRNTVMIAGLFVGIFVLGVIITWISTFIATQRFLNLKTDQLYY